MAAHRVQIPIPALDWEREIFREIQGETPPTRKFNRGDNARSPQESTRAPRKGFNTHATHFDLMQGLSGHRYLCPQVSCLKPSQSFALVAAQYSAMRLIHLTSILPSASLALAWTTYVVPHSQGYDDTPALAAALAADPKLATDATILFEQGVTYNILTPICFPYLENVVISIQGNLTYAADIKATQGENPVIG